MFSLAYNSFNYECALIPFRFNSLRDSLSVHKRHHSGPPALTTSKRFSDFLVSTITRSSINQFHSCRFCGGSRRKKRVEKVGRSLMVASYLWDHTKSHLQTSDWVAEEQTRRLFNSGNVTEIDFRWANNYVMFPKMKLKQCKRKANRARRGNGQSHKNHVNGGKKVS